MKTNKITENYLKEKNLSYLASKEERDIKKFLRFDEGEDYTADNKIINFFDHIKNVNLKSYPDNLHFNMKDIIADKFKLSPNQIVFGSGSDEFIETLPRIVLEPGDSSLIISPTFFRFSDAVKRSGGKTIYVNTSEENNFEIDEDVIDNAIKKTNSENVKILWLCNPNNPTGNIINKNLVKKVLDNVNCIVVLDEAFFEFYDPENKESFIHLVSKYENLIVLRSISKANGFAGLRLGYAVANEDAINILERYRLPYNISLLSQIIFNYKFKDQNDFKKHILYVNRLRDEFVSDLKKIPEVAIGGNTQANIIFFKVKNVNIAPLLHNKGIICADFNNLSGLENKYYVRVTIRGEEDNKIFIKKLKECIMENERKLN